LSLGALARAVAAEPQPCALIDVSAFDANVAHLLGPVRASGKTLRPASKSLRCTALLRRLGELAPDCVRGVLCYAAGEAAFLAERGFDDLLVAYPTVGERDLAVLAGLSGRASLVADCAAHVDAAEAAARRNGAVLPLLLDLDMAWQPVGLYLGVRRSPLREPTDAAALADRIAASPHLRFRGVMGYEAQIAGLQDRNPFAPLLNRPKQLIRSGSKRDVAARRAEIVAALRDRGHACEVVNGGGSGSLAWSCTDPSLTEVTAGSGFVDPHGFDYFSDLSLRPAAFFALPVVRIPGPGYATVFAGGYVASGPAGPDKLPRPAFPEGLSLLPDEGAGEVQTPLRVPRDVSLRVGDTVLFRHGKGGELSERFASYLLVRGEEIVDRVPTYRGEGGCFG
jgi:D-serine deaminase-like pyridoxal phosphate-dependent protein